MEMLEIAVTWAGGRVQGARQLVVIPSNVTVSKEPANHRPPSPPRPIIAQLSPGTAAAAAAAQPPPRTPRRSRAEAELQLGN